MTLKLYRVSSTHTTGNPEYGKFQTLVVASSLEKAVNVYKEKYKGPIITKVMKLNIVGDEILIQKKENNEI